MQCDLCGAKFREPVNIQKVVSSVIGKDVCEPCAWGTWNRWCESERETNRCSASKPSSRDS